MVCKHTGFANGLLTMRALAFISGGSPSGRSEAIRLPPHHAQLHYQAREANETVTSDQASSASIDAMRYTQSTQTKATGKKKGKKKRER